MKVMVSLASSKFMERFRDGFGTEISNGFGYICVLTGSKYSPTRHSVTEFVVDENQRGKGHGKELIQEVIRRYKTDIGGQVSSTASMHAFHKCGFRPYISMGASLKEALSLFNDTGSLLMVYKPANQNEE